MYEKLRMKFCGRSVRKKDDHGTRVLVTFFLGVILAGSILLNLPAASKNGVSCGFLTALFTATSCTCVTGLSLVDTFTQWTVFGQIVLLCLIQIGGLGYMTFVSVFYFMLRRKIGLRERLILRQAMALNELDGILRLLKLVIAGTFMIEGIGAAILAGRFSTVMPLGQAVYFGVFHAVSAFCNAGFDLFGMYEPGSSLTLLAGDWVVNLVIMALIVVAGLGFFVWNDLLIHRFRWRRMNVYTKLVLLLTAGLLLGGAGLFLLLEWNNPATMGSMSVGEKVLAALFQSVTTRTAGFFTVDQGALTESSRFISILLMFVGGSSGSTAGGIKTVTVGILMLSVLRAMRGHSETVVFGRKISRDQLSDALTIFVLIILIGISGGIVVAATNGVPLLDAMYETVSAICTVGLSTGITAGLNVCSKVLLIVLMFFGRVGVMTISFAFMVKTPDDNAIRRPETRVLIG